MIAGLIASRAAARQPHRPADDRDRVRLAARPLTDSPNDVVFTLGLILEQRLAGAAGPPAAVVPERATSTAAPRIIVIAGYMDTLGAVAPAPAVLAAAAGRPGSEPRFGRQPAAGLAPARGRARRPGDRVRGRPGDRGDAAVVVWQRWRAASPATRRVLAPMYSPERRRSCVLLLVVHRAVHDLLGVAADGAYLLRLLRVLHGHPGRIPVRDPAHPPGPGSAVQTLVRPCAPSAPRAGCATRCGSRSTIPHSTWPIAGRGRTSTWT